MNGLISNRARVSRNTNLKAITVAVFLLFLFRLWSFVLTRTVVASVMLQYISYISVFFAFAYALFSNNGGKLSKLSIWWLPYILLTILGYLFVNRNFERMAWWFAPLAMLLLAPTKGFLKSVPVKLIFWTGIISMIGVYFQYFFLSLYNSIIAPYIIADAATSLEDLVGMRGFSHQQGTTSIMLVFGEMALLFFKNDVLPPSMKKKLIYWCLVALIIIAIFMTGKRMVSLLAVTVPVIVFLLSSKKGKTRVFRISLVAVVAFGIYQFVLPLLLESSDIYVIQRFATSLDKTRGGEDISSGRDYLWDLAKDAYRAHPVMGIGVGRYSTYTGAETDTHNTYLQTLCEQGIVGFVSYVVAIFLCLLHTIRIFDKTNDSQLKKYMKAAISIEFVYILYAITGNVNIDVDVMMYFLAIAIVIQVETVQKTKRI